MRKIVLVLIISHVLEILAWEQTLSASRERDFLSALKHM
jgi:hypothetical protein